jgi:HEAT repeat protein
MRRVIGRLTQVLLVVVAATLVVQVGVALGVARTSKPVVFVPFPAGAAQATQTRQVSDSAQVRALLQAARGTNGLVCELAARTVDGRFGWSSSDGSFSPGASADSLGHDVVSWVHERKLDPSTVPLLRAAITDQDWCVRRLAAPILGHVRDASAMQAMLAALSAPEPGTREMAALALGFAADTRAVTPLVARLSDESARVRATAAWALGEIESKEAVRPLIGALRDSDALVRESAAQALGEVEDTAGIAPLTDVLKSDRAASVRRAAARALGEIAG